MPTRVIDSAIRLLERLQHEHRTEVESAYLDFVIEEVVGSDKKRTMIPHKDFLLRHKFIEPKPSIEGVYIVNFDKIYQHR
ncbi:MAG: hypothetical protein WC613_05240 [Candidatus Aenigmatarchaeota archaeon]